MTKLFDKYTEAKDEIVRNKYEINLLLDELKGFRAIERAEQEEKEAKLAKEREAMRKIQLEMINIKNNHTFQKKEMKQRLTEVAF